MEKMRVGRGTGYWGWEAVAGEVSLGGTVRMASRVRGEPGREPSPRDGSMQGRECVLEGQWGGPKVAPMTV